MEVPLQNLALMLTAKAATVFLIFYIFFSFTCMQQIGKMKENSELGLGFNR